MKDVFHFSHIDKMITISVGIDIILQQASGKTSEEYARAELVGLNIPYKEAFDDSVWRSWGSYKEMVENVAV